MVVQTYPTPAWWATTRMVIVFGRGDAGASSFAACRGDVELLPEGVAVRRDPTPDPHPYGPPVLLPWTSVGQLAALTDAQADTYGCP